MAKKSPKSQPTPYKVWMKPEVHAARKQLPGYIRQHLMRMLDDLAQDPRPGSSQALTYRIESDRNGKHAALK